MKVIILNGSPKAEGNTATALHEVERTLNQQGIETEWIHVGHRQIHGCIACNKCWDTNECCFHDIVNEISEKMDAADGLLIGFPCISLRHQAPYSHFSTVSSTPLFTRTG